MCDQIVNLTPQIQAGSIKAYGIATEKRSPALPDVPTTKEGGLPEFQVSAWNAMFAPKGTPGEIVTKLNAALGEGARRRVDPQAAAGSGRRPSRQGGSLARGAAELVASEIERWGKVLKGQGAGK